MANSQHCSDYSDTEDCISDRTSNLSLSIGYFPCEHSFYSDTPSYADSSSVDSSVHLLPPIQGTWQTESTRRRVLRRDQVKDSPEQFCKLSIALAWDIDVDSDCEDTRTNWARSGDQQWTDKYPAESTKRTLSKLGDLMQKLETFLENKKNDEENDSVSPASTEEEDSRLSSTSPPHLAQQMTAQATGSQRTNVSLTSFISLEKLEKEDPRGKATPPNTHTIFCLNFGRFFRWLRKQVLSPLRRRDQPEKAPEAPRQKAPRKRHCRRSKRIQPQESLEEGPCVPSSVLLAPVPQSL
ncbi:uncharacterized protein C12orf71 homolog isoform X1 [Oryctolagus cuniculus]|uniref:uncharacterized protein C12orf71 homolog isoform X1 n=1 Tax=Oryctolagus cuniculus TaxID=9986 RepID=UPI003879FB44